MCADSPYSYASLFSSKQDRTSAQSHNHAHSCIINISIFFFSFNLFACWIGQTLDHVYLYGFISLMYNQYHWYCYYYYYNYIFYRYAIKDIYTVVADIDKYKEFLPWCAESVVIKRSDRHCVANLAVGFPPLVEKYTSFVTFRPYTLLRVCPVN